MIDATDFIELTKLISDRTKAKIRTAVPGVVRAFDPETQTATVQVAVAYAYLDPDAVEEVQRYIPRPITNCPVIFPQGGGFSLRFPLEPGDDCLILVAERSIDEWAATGNAGVTPRDLRRFDLSDALVLPAPRPAARPLEDFRDDAVELRHDASGRSFRIRDDGKIAIGDGTNELLDIVHGLIGDLLTAIMPGSSPPGSPFDPATLGALGALQTQLALLKE